MRMVYDIDAVMVRGVKYKVFQGVFGAKTVQFLILKHCKMGLEAHLLGREAEKHEPRWSVVRDVLHWIE